MCDDAMPEPLLCGRYGRDPCPDALIKVSPRYAARPAWVATRALRDPVPETRGDVLGGRGQLFLYDDEGRLR
ncbi:hypothetical protein ABZ079_27600 [Streptomyces sp. NPDC006314]|uniref:hypothetical protein n=1 Tax=Streptomyces sp. NPDC006314 TaxID=3154475 RepID=UPI0033B747A4